MRTTLTTLMDAVGVLLLAAGVGCFVGQWIGWAALAVAGVVVLAADAVSEWVNR